MDTLIRVEVSPDTYHVWIRSICKIVHDNSMLCIAVSIIFDFFFKCTKDTYWIPVGYNKVTFVKK